MRADEWPAHWPARPERGRKSHIVRAAEGSWYLNPRDYLNEAESPPLRIRGLAGARRSPGTPPRRRRSW